MAKRVKALLIAWSRMGTTMVRAHKNKKIVSKEKPNAQG